MLYSRETIDEVAKIICQKMVINNVKVTEINNKSVEKLVDNALLECTKIEMAGQNRMFGIEKQRLVKLFDEILNTMLMLQTNPHSANNKAFVGVIYRKFCGFKNRFKDMK